MAKGKRITEVTEQMLDEFLRSKGLKLYDVEYVKEGPDRVLRVFIDKDEGYIGTEDCEDVSRFLSDRLDEIDPIEENYVLEVSSPGLDRELKTDEHFQRYLGEMIEVSLYKVIDGEKKLTGILLSKDEDCVKIEVDEKEITVPLKQITKVNLAITI